MADEQAARPESLDASAPPESLPRGLATTSLVLSIVGLVLLLWIGAWSPSVVAFVLGLVALRRARAGRAGGRKRAIAGILIGGTGIAHIVFTLLVVAPLSPAAS